ncbi:hypothetical protein BDC45DRAFT_17853 [Circinella umbellata]|nr:hypothetical protein BDC45DRAFT_17853 [Circinella umbellata]
MLLVRRKKILMILFSFSQSSESSSSFASVSSRPLSVVSSIGGGDLVKVVHLHHLLLLFRSTPFIIALEVSMEKKKINRKSR